jgi:hypothetical protein
MVTFTIVNGRRAAPCSFHADVSSEEMPYQFDGDG